MPGAHARIYRDIWLNEDFLDLSQPAQTLYFYLVSAPGLSLAGVRQWRPRAAAQTSPTWTRDGIDAAFEELQQALFVLHDEDTEEVLIRSHVRHDGLLDSPNMAVAYHKAFALIGSRLLRSVAMWELHRLRNEFPDLKGWGKLTPIMKFPGTDPREVLARMGRAREAAPTDREVDLPVPQIRREYAY